MKKETWFKFIETFTKNVCKTKISQNDRGNTHFKTSQIFGLNVTLSNNYGFLEVLFSDHRAEQEFLDLSTISKNSTSINDIKHVETKWDASRFPCRVFVENKKVQFYDKTNDLPVDEMYDNRVVVLNSVFNVLVDMKIKNSMNH